MAFSDIDTVRAAVNQLTDATAAALPEVAGAVYGNMDDLVLSEGNAPYFKQRIMYQDSSQLFLGAPQSARQRGSVIFTLYVPKGVGDGPRDRMHKALVSSFRGKVIGGAVFSRDRVLTSGASGNWATTGINFPFYFDQLS